MYWRDDKAFYPAEIMGYDTTTGRHEVEYDDGEPLSHTQRRKRFSSLQLVAETAFPCSCLP